MFSAETLAKMESDYYEHHRKLGTATPIPWATIIQIIEAVLQMLGPILANPPTPAPAPAS